MEAPSALPTVTQLCGNLVTRSWSIAAIRTRQLVPVYAISEIKQRVGFSGSSVQSSLRNLGAIFDAQRRLRITPCFYRLRNKLSSD